MSLYRNVVSPPYNLNDRLRVALEERLYPQAIELFSAILFDGISLPEDELKPGLMPSSVYVRLVTTLLAFPYYTSQVRDHLIRSTAPTDAYILLRRLLAINGPQNADVKNAWKFDTDATLGRKIRQKRNHSSSVTPCENISGELANEESLFSCAEDVWAVIGWAFNCSASHPERWRWWRNFLNILIVGLEKDLDAKIIYNEDLSESLIVNMLPADLGSGGCRRVIRAIFANNSLKDRNEFTQVWPGELRKTSAKKRGRCGLDDPASDTQSDDEPEVGLGIINRLGKNDGQEVRTPRRIGNAILKWGGVESLQLRQRFLSLISAISHKGLFIPLYDLHSEYKEIIISFDLSSFSLFTSDFFKADVGYRSFLNQVILEALISSVAPFAEPHENELTQSIFIRRFLPFHANKNSSVDNAKVAMLLETLMRLLIKEGLLNWSDELQTAIETGIKARNQHQTSRSRMTTEIELREFNEFWKASENKLRIMAKVLKSSCE